MNKDPVRKQLLTDLVGLSGERLLHRKRAQMVKTQCRFVLWYEHGVNKRPGSVDQSGLVGEHGVNNSAMYGDHAEPVKG